MWGPLTPRASICIFASSSRFLTLVPDSLLDLLQSSRCTALILWVLRLRIFDGFIVTPVGSPDSSLDVRSLLQTGTIHFFLVVLIVTGFPSVPTKHFLTCPLHFAFTPSLFLPVKTYSTFKTLLNPLRLLPEALSTCTVCGRLSNFRNTSAPSNWESSSDSLGGNAS